MEVVGGSIPLATTNSLTDPRMPRGDSARMLARAGSKLILLVALGAVPAWAARVNVQLEGLNEEMRDAVRATLALGDYEKRDISAAELRAAYRDSDEQIRRALEPFGFY